jgi:F0F1-type ATP synthase alpha subunit
MGDWKEVNVISYLELEEEKIETEKEMANSPAIVELKEKLNAIKGEINLREFGYVSNIRNCERAMRSIKEELIKDWDIKDKSFKCAEGDITIRTTRSLKVDNKETLIGILQQIGKLTQSIKGWDLTYLRKLADAGLFDVDKEEMNIMHYEEKKNVVINAAKKESDSDEE